MRMQVAPCTPARVDSSPTHPRDAHKQRTGGAGIGVDLTGVNVSNQDKRRQGGELPSRSDGTQRQQSHHKCNPIQPSPNRHDTVQQPSSHKANIVQQPPPHEANMVQQQSPNKPSMVQRPSPERENMTRQPLEQDPVRRERVVNATSRMVQDLKVEDVNDEDRQQSEQEKAWAKRQEARRAKKRAQ